MGSVEGDPKRDTTPKVDAVPAAAEQQAVDDSYKSGDSPYEFSKVRDARGCYEPTIERRMCPLVAGQQQRQVGVAAVDGGDQHTMAGGHAAGHLVTCRRQQCHLLPGSVAKCTLDDRLTLCMPVRRGTRMLRTSRPRLTESTASEARPAGVVEFQMMGGRESDATDGGLW